MILYQIINVYDDVVGFEIDGKKYKVNSDGFNSGTIQELDGNGYPKSNIKKYWTLEEEE